MVEVVEAFLQRSGRGGNWMPSTTFLMTDRRKVEFFLSPSGEFRLLRAFSLSRISLHFAGSFGEYTKR